MNATVAGGALPLPRDQQVTPTPAADNDSIPGLDGINSDIKQEDDVSDQTIVLAQSSTTATTLRPDLQPSKKRRESEAGDATTSDSPDGQPPFKKRKRAVSPPWQFPTAENSTLKSLDGRRISARFNTSTPVLSENEGHAPSSSRAASTSRAPSPPWKRFDAQVPTTVHVDGVRKSGRVNKELGDTPKRTSPRNKKHVAVPRAKQVPANPTPTADIVPVKRGPGRPRKHPLPTVSAKVEELKARIAELKPEDSSSAEQELDEIIPVRRKRRISNHDRDGKGNRPASPTSLRRSHRASNAPLSPDASRPTPRIKLRFTPARQAILPPHPSAVFPMPLHPPHPSLWQLVDELDLKEMQQPYSENERGPPSREEFEHRHQKAAEQEGVMRQTLINAGKPGGVLSKEVCSIYHDDQQPELQPQYGHKDHLLAHALYFRQLQNRENQHHRQLAKKLANEALEYWKLKKGPTEEDLQAEADKIFRLIARQVVVDIKAKWDRVFQHVEDRRKEEWEAEQELKRQERLRKQLEWSENMVARQRGEMGSDADMSDQDEALELDDSEDADGNDASDEDDDSEENMTDEESMSGHDDEEEGDMEEDTLRAYLAQKESEPPEGPQDLQDLLNEGIDPSDDQQSDEDDDAAADPTTDLLEGTENLPTDRMNQQTHSKPDESSDDHFTNLKPLDTSESDAPISAQTDPALENGVPHSPRKSLPADDMERDSLLDSDESVDMDSEDYDSDEDMDDSDAESDDSGQGESDASEKPASRSGLLALFSKAELRAQGLPTPVTSAEGDHVNERDATHEHQELINVDMDTDEVPSHDVVARTEESHDTDANLTFASGFTTDTMEPVTSDLQAASQPATPTSQSPSDSYGKQLVPTPSLLRGTLRSYQHAGVDWLASLYRNGTNGILADEMGLGKTIQTIALFAHLAEQYQVWDAHLVIVPTSVILNWVTEFQKFLPGFRVLGYYGTTEERQAKRRGWVNDPHHEIKEKRGYNVVITSYNVALKDINAIRNVPWHYMVLDEAHNIRNFNSQRFQVLIRLKTRARLLLTGTPLQNSLTELWSLLTFLTAGDDDPAHGSLEEFLSHWKEPVKEIFDRGVQSLSDEASKVVGQLHTSLRPFMLRRLKADVEKDLPKKTEHTVVCKLSKRQRQLYQDYMGLADTRAKLTNGNAVTAGKVLLSLRRVCNHPDLFDPRPIQTSYALEKSPLEPYTIKEQLVRRLFGFEDPVPARARITSLEVRKRFVSTRSRQLSGVSSLQRQVDNLTESLPQTEPDLSTSAGSRAWQRLQQKQKRLQQLRDAITFTDASTSGSPIYGADLREMLTVRSTKASAGCMVTGRLQFTTVDALVNPSLSAKSESFFDRKLAPSTLIQQSLMSVLGRAERMHEILKRFVFCTPEATAPVLDLVLPKRIQEVLRADPRYCGAFDPAHEARIRTSIVFPDARLLVYDSGKLQRLSLLLRELQSRGSRSLIFTQMTGTLNILEQFLSLLNLPYLRLDGSTPVERRQLYSAEFNRPDSKYQCMILSSRAGGVGLNLTGASSVIFYDLDWNPQMDKQCMDRAHRIGQVRDVEVYKMVSEKTVEENILRRANQKSLLDQTVIQEGHFTTDYHREDKAPAEDDVTAAIDRFLSGGDKTLTKTIESVEDKEDVQAAQQARKEEMQDDEDFAERSSKGPSIHATPGPNAADGGEHGADLDGHVDGYMIRFIEAALKHVPYIPPVVRKLDKHGRDPSHRPKKKR